MTARALLALTLLVLSGCSAGEPTGNSEAAIANAATALEAAANATIGPRIAELEAEANAALAAPDGDEDEDEDSLNRASGQKDGAK